MANQLLKYNHFPLKSCAVVRIPPIMRLPSARPPMPFSIRPHRRFPVPRAVTYKAGPFQGQGTVWNLSCSGWRLSGDLPMRPGDTLAGTVTLQNEQRIVVPEAVVWWSRGQGAYAPCTPQSPHDSNHRSLNTHPHSCHRAHTRIGWYRYSYRRRQSQPSQSARPTRLGGPRQPSSPTNSERPIEHR